MSFSWHWNVWVNVYFGKQYGAPEKSNLQIVRTFGARDLGLIFNTLPSMLRPLSGDPVRWVAH